MPAALSFNRAFKISSEAAGPDSSQGDRSRGEKTQPERAHVPKTQRCANRCYRFFFSSLPHSGFLCCRQGLGSCVAMGLELVHPFGRGRVREVC